MGCDALQVGACFAEDLGDAFGGWWWYEGGHYLVGVVMVARVVGGKEDGPDRVLALRLHSGCKITLTLGP